MTQLTARTFNPTTSNHAAARRHKPTLVGIAGLAVIGLFAACSSTSTTITPGNSDAGTHVGGTGNGGSSGAAGANSGGATSTNCLKLGVTGCTNSCCEAEAGAVCVSDQCVINAPLANGTSCTGPAECNAKTCLAGTCGPPPCRNTGESCDGDFPCCSGQYCDGAGTCQLMRTNGQSCSSTQTCAAGLQCNSTTNVCETCTLCGTNPCCGACVNNLCALKLPVTLYACLLNGQEGDACTSPAGCCSNNCVNLVCAKACTAVGGLCSISADCCSAECLSNTCVYSSCNAVGEACNTNLNCCSNHCGTDAKCQ